MVNSNVFDMHSYEIKSNKTYFFDNNIWMFLFCPIGNINKVKQQKIASFLSNLITRNCSIITNGLIISEFSNAYLKLDFDLFKKDGNIAAKFKKDYFPTQKCFNTRLAIVSSLKQIEKVSMKYSDQYNSVSIENIYKKYLQLDFNDSYFLELCESNGWILVTDDKDFFDIETSAVIVKS